MDGWRIESVAVCAGIEDTVSGVGEEVVEGVGGVEINIYNDYLLFYLYINLFSRWINYDYTKNLMSAF